MTLESWIEITLSFGIYLNEEGKILVSDTPFSTKGKKSIPCVLTNLESGENTMAKLTALFEKEYGIDLYLLYYMNYTKGINKSNVNEQILTSRNYCYTISKAGEYMKNSKTGEWYSRPMKMDPSGQYENMEYLTYEEIVERWKNDKITDTTMFFIKEAKLRNKLLPVKKVELK